MDRPAYRSEIEAAMLEAMQPHISIGSGYYDVSEGSADDAISDILDKLLSLGADVSRIRKP